MMKNYYFLAITLFLFSAVNAQIINFPDANFKAKLLQPNAAYDFMNNVYITIDANNDGEIEVNEIQSVTHLWLSNANISDLTGISYFTNLRALDCSNNLLQHILIGNTNVALKNLKCNNNMLQSIVIDHSVTLNSLYASHNQLTDESIDVLYAHGIDEYDEYVPRVDLSYNNLTSFTVRGYHVSLNCSHNPLTTFNLNGSTVDYLVLNFTSLTSIAGTGRLKYAYLQNNQFSLLDLTNISFNQPHRGSWIYLGNNTVDRVVFGANSPDNLYYSSANTFVDLINYRGSNWCNNADDTQIEESGKINIVDCPNLKFINLKNGFIYQNVQCSVVVSGETWTQSTLRLQITNCPNLSFMCVDEEEQEHIQSKINALGLQNQVQVNSYCSFVPGGTYYTLQGNTRFDANGNGCDSGDFNIPLQKFKIVQGTTTNTVVGQADGDYAIYFGSGTNTVTPIIENPAYYTVSPASLEVNFPSQASPVAQDFCVSVNGAHPDLKITVLPVDAARPGFDSHYKIICENKGTVTESGSIQFNYDESVLDFVAATPSAQSQSASQLIFDFDALKPFETRQFLVTLNANSPMETPALNGGDTLNFSTAIVSVPTDETPEDNIFVLPQPVVNSLDPNDKTCLEGTKMTPEMVGKEVHYMIRFENTGTANAENIVVKDMIDTTKFDISSLIPIDGSHPFVTKISNTNKVEFIFENINLPFDDANNDGYVAFKIKTKPTLVLGDTFSNTASIYFDYNFPIVTDPAVTTVALLVNPDFAFESYFKIYPNPVHDVLNIETIKTIEMTSINVYNTLGQLILVIPNAQQTKSIDVSTLKAGNYFIKINADQGTSSLKFIKK